MKILESKLPDSTRRFFLYGLLGGLVATLVLYVGTIILALPFPPEAVFSILIAPVPGSIQSVVVETFREYAKYTAFVFSTLIYVVMYGVLSVLVGKMFGKALQSKREAAFVTAMIVPSIIALVFDLPLASRSSTLASSSGWLLSLLVVLVANFGFAGVFVQQTRTLKSVRQTSLPGPSNAVGKLSRRGFLSRAVIIAAVLAVAGLGAKIGLDVLSGQPVVGSNTPIPVNIPSATSTAVTSATVAASQNTTEVVQALPAVFSDPRIKDLIASEVTDNRVFYRVDINPIPPQLDFDQWSLQITGKVSNPVTLDEAALMALPVRDEYATLECVSNTINPPGALISNAKWTGVSLSSLLNQASPTSDAKYVVFHCADGYTVGIPLERAMNPGAILAFKMNDDALPSGHGFPLRAIVPGIYGMMNAKWITEIELVDTVYLGYWQVRGWSNDARIKTTSIVYYPAPGAQVNGTLPIAGVAFAGDRGISKVEVSVDGGATWNPATIKPPRSPYSWVLWAYEWNAARKGNTPITVRAYDGTGTVQDATNTQPFPDGASGYQQIQVTVT